MTSNDYRDLIDRLEPGEEDLYFKTWRVCVWIDDVDHITFISGKLFYDMTEAEEYARYINGLVLNHIYAKVVPGYELE